MKRFIFLLLVTLFSIHISISQSTWQITNPPAIGDFVSVCFTDEARGWIVAVDGTMIKTTDGGMTWNIYYPFPGFHINSICFSDENHGCMVGWELTGAGSSLILVTFDGGENWSLGNHDAVNKLNDVFFINNEKGWAVGSRESYNMNCCLHTLDGGNTWDLQESILVAGAELYGVHFRDENIGQTCGADGAFFLTNNGGGTGWALGISMPFVNLNDIFNFGSQAGCMVGDAGKVLYTINNWYQYIEQNSGTIENLHGVSGNPATNEVWAVGDNGTIIYTSNYLLGWTTQSSGVIENLNDVCMLSSSEGWAVGDNGTILHFSNTSSIENNVDSQIRVYPNPVSDILFIKTDDPKNIEQIQLYSIEGKLVFQRSSSHDYMFEIDVSNLLPGIYYLKIRYSSISAIRKIVIK